MTNESSVSLKACRRSLTLLRVSIIVVFAVFAGCSASGSPDPRPGASIYGVDVAGDWGSKPIVRIAAPLKVSTTTSQVAIVGTGAPIQVDQLFVLQLTIYNARTGAEVASTLDEGEVPLVAKSSDDTLFPELVSALAGIPQGSRVVLALTASDGYGSGGVPPTGLEPDDPTVVVADVLAVPPTSSVTAAQGRQVTHANSTPKVRLLAGDPVAVTFPDGASAPSAVTVVKLIEGSGEPVRDRSLVTMNFLGQDWGSATPFVDTYFKEPVVMPVGAEGSMPAWDQALVGLNAGSRIMVIDPNPPTRVPGELEAAEHGTITWVIDLLGVS